MWSLTTAKSTLWPGHLLVLVEAVERAHDQDHVAEAGVTQGDGFLGGRHRHPVRPCRHRPTRATGSVPWP